MHIPDLYKNNDFIYSIEVMPPRNGGSIEQLFKTIDHAADWVKFISITYGSGGALRGGTGAIAALIKQKYGITTLTHLTCLGVTKQDIENILMLNKYLDLDNILALRGDPPWGVKKFKPVKGGYKYASGLVKQISEMNKGHYIIRETDYDFFKLPRDAKYREGEATNFSICVAGYPEKHIEAPNMEEDIQHLKEKIDAGAESVITQMIFSAEIYREFIKKTRSVGIDVPIIPGVLPISTFGQINMIKNIFHAKIPKHYENDIVKNKDNKEKLKGAGIKHTIRLVYELKEVGAPGVHFYTMNNSALINTIFNALKTEKLI